MSLWPPSIPPPQSLPPKIFKSKKKRNPWNMYISRRSTYLDLSMVEERQTKDSGRKNKTTRHFLSLSGVLPVKKEKKERKSHKSTVGNKEYIYRFNKNTDNIKQLAAYICYICSS